MNDVFCLFREDDPTSKLLVNGQPFDSKPMKPMQSTVAVQPKPFPITLPPGLIKESHPVNSANPGNHKDSAPVTPKHADHGLDVKAWELRHTAQKLGGAGRIPQNADT